MDETIKACRDCRWCKPNPELIFRLTALFGDKSRWNYATCLHPDVGTYTSAGRYHLGLPPAPAKPKNVFASSARELEHLCGPKARLFEQRTPRRAGRS